jgi:cytochrome P450
MAARGELDYYVDDMVARRRRDTTEDLMSGLIRAEHDGAGLDSSELRMLVAAMLLAGTDTTRNRVAASIDILSITPINGIFCVPIPNWLWPPSMG